MSQFDFPSAAALEQIKNENGPPASPVIKLAGKLTELAGVLAEASGMKGASAATNLFKKLMDVAPSKDEANFLYFAEWVVYDFQSLYRLLDEAMKQIVNDRIKTQEAIEILVNATLHVPRTNIEIRLQRLAHIFVNGVKEYDLAPESTDDMMRAAVELNEFDLKVLKEIYESQKALLQSYPRLEAQWAEQVANVWATKLGMSGEPNWMGARGSLAKLQSFGFISLVTSNMTTTGDLSRQPYGLLPDGKKFFERIQELAKQ